MARFLVLAIALMSVGVIAGVLVALLKRDWQNPRANKPSLVLFGFLMAVVLGFVLYGLYGLLPSY